MRTIQTKPHFDENGERQLKDESCPGVCVRGSATPDVCIWYQLKSMGARGMLELCGRDEECEV